jgi:hypothetical protein
MLPTDFKLKRKNICGNNLAFVVLEVVEMMHKMCNDQASGGQWRIKICSQCAACGDIKNYFVCESCADGDLMVFSY